MDQIFCDASYKNGLCGIAAATSRALWNEGKELRKGSVFRKIAPLFQAAILEKEDCIVYFSAFPCAGSNEAEIRALGLAVAMAEEILSSEKRAGRLVEISSDSLVALGDILSPEAPLFKESEILRDRIATARIVLSKVKAHAGHLGNTIVDEWSRKARRDLESEAAIPRVSRAATRETKARNGSLSAAKEEDGEMRDFTKRILDERIETAVITGDGRIVPRRHALKSGDRRITELHKERVWGG